MSYITQAGGWVLTAAFGVAFSVVAQEPIQLALARCFGSLIPRSARGVKGLWRSSYVYYVSGIAHRETQIIELRQFGKFVFGKNLTAQAHWQRLKGKVHMEQFFMGMWEDTTDGVVYQGTFNFQLDANGKVMRGSYSGFDDQYKLVSGAWEWQKISKKINKRTRAKAIKDFESETSAAVTVITAA
jgi:hypothetical protein